MLRRLKSTAVLMTAYCDRPLTPVITSRRSHAYALKKVSEPGGLYDIAAVDVDGAVDV